MPFPSPASKLELLTGSAEVNAANVDGLAFFFGDRDGGDAGVAVAGGAGDREDVLVVGGFGDREDSRRGNETLRAGKVLGTPVGGEGK